MTAERWPGYTTEAQAYEEATRPAPRSRTVTVELTPIEPVFAKMRGHGHYRPVSLREWTAIERKCRKPFSARWPRKSLGIAGAPPARLEDGRTVSEALDSRR